MTTPELQRQLALINLLIEGAESDPALRSDLPIAAAKIRLLIRLAPDHASTCPHLPSQLHELRARWSRAYFGTDAAPESSPQAQSRTNTPTPNLIRSPWSIEEERRCLSLLDSDLGMFLFMKFGRVAQEARGDDGRWHLIISKTQIFDAQKLRGTATPEQIEKIAAQAMLIRELPSFAEVIAPATFELFVTKSPREVMDRIKEALSARSQLKELHVAESGASLQLSEAGLRSSKAALIAWRHALILPDPPVNHPHSPPGDDIPF
jgi:hypothetical protein